MVKITLPEIKKMLTSFDFQVSHYKSEEDKTRQEELFVYIGEDLEKRPYLLQIRIFDKQMISQTLGEENPDSFLSLNFFLAIPFEIPEEFQAQVCRLALIANKMMPFQTFGFSENDRIVYCQYNYPYLKAEMHENILLGIISSFIFGKDSFVQFFNDIATGKATCESLIKESEDFMKEKK